MIIKVLEILKERECIQIYEPALGQPLSSRFQVDRRKAYFEKVLGGTLCWQLHWLAVRFSFEEKDAK